MDVISIIQNSMFIENYCIWAYNFYVTVTCNEAATRKKFVFSSLTLSIFHALEIKKLALVDKYYVST